MQLLFCSETWSAQSILFEDACPGVSRQILFLNRLFSCNFSIATYNFSIQKSEGLHRSNYRDTQRRVCAFVCFSPSLPLNILFKAIFCLGSVGDGIRRSVRSLRAQSNLHPRPARPLYSPSGIAKGSLVLPQEEIG